LNAYNNLAGYLIDFQDSIIMEREKDIILQICRDQYDHKEVSSEELLIAVKQLNTNKAADYFGITAENIIYMLNYPLVADL
jgi:hypothetical protein